MPVGVHFRSILIIFHGHGKVTGAFSCPRARPKAPIRIKWSLVCVGYQPRLALAWSACMRSFGEEAKQDRVFEESLFWVVTRTIHCFY